MEENKYKFRLRLNLFDGIILVVALAVAAVLLWMAVKPQAVSNESSTAAATVRYTIRFQRWIEGTGSIIQPGDKLVDNIKNNELGQVVSTQAVPAQTQLLDQESHSYVLAAVPGYEDILVTVEAPCTVSEEAVILGSKFQLLVGSTAYIRGEGYMASGPIISIEREGQELSSLTGRAGCSARSVLSTCWSWPSLS